MPKVEVTETLFGSSTENIDRCYQQAVALSSAIPVSADRKRLAEHFCYIIVNELWEKTVQSHRPSWDLPAYSLQGPAPETAVKRIAENIARLLLMLDPATAGYQLGSLYSALLPPDIRSDWGVFYTPPPLVERLIATAARYGLNWKTATIIDPACGGAAFLAPLAHHIARQLAVKEGYLPGLILEHISLHLRGVEIDPFAAWMSQTLTEIRLIPLELRCNQRLSPIIHVGNALTDLIAHGGRYNLVIGNPPYGKIRLAEELRRTYSRSLYGHANLYGLFTDLALRIAADDGLIAFVTPTSFLAGQYFKSLRRVLADEAPPVSVDFVHQRDGIFTDVLQETTLVVFKKTKNPVVITDIHLLDTARRSGGIRISRVTRYANKKLDEGPWLLPRTQKQTALLDRIAQMKNRLVDLGFSVSTGPLVWNRHKNQLREKTNYRTVPLIWSESVLANGSFTFSSNRINHKPFFELDGEKGYLLTKEPCILVQRTTAKEQHRRLIAAILPRSFLEEHPNGVVIENHLNVIRRVNSNRVALEAVCALLNSAAVDQVFRCISGSVAVSAYELNAIPLPELEELWQLQNMIQQGSTSREVNGYIAQIYGMEG